MAKSSALKKLQTQKGTKPKVAPKKLKKASKPVTKKKEEKVHSVEEILVMKTDDLDFAHSKLPEELDSWADLDRTEKRQTLAAALHEDYAESLEEEEADEEDLDEEDEEDEESSDLDEELEEEAEEDEGKVVPIKKKASKAKNGTAGKAKNAPAKKAKSKKTKINENDVLAVTVNNIENLSEEQADSEVFVLKDDIEFNYFRLGGVLAIIKENKFIGEYDTFREKVEAEFGMKYRKAEYLINIYNNILESGVEWDSLKDIGWSKLSLISHLITPDNVEEWVAKAQEMNWTSLSNEVKEMRKSGTKEVSKARKSDITRMTFQVHEDQRETIELAIEKAKEETETDVNTVALEYICMEYNSGGKKPVTVKEPTIEQFFKALVKKSDGDEELALGELLEGKAFKKVFGYTIDQIDFSGDEEEGEDE